MFFRIFSNNCFCVSLDRDAVTCVQFNPVDDGYFLSGALDDKLRIWNIAEHQVVDWVDLREMITALAYTPDGEVLLDFLFDFLFHPGMSVSYLLLVEDLTKHFCVGIRKQLLVHIKGLVASTIPQVCVCPFS